jgi:hypothetical protein
LELNTYRHSVSENEAETTEKSATKFRAGDVFNPWNRFRGIFIPLSLFSYDKLSAGAKLLYGRLALYRGKRNDGICNPSLDTLAKETGASADTLGRWLKELTIQGFIRRVHRGPKLNAECQFLWHPVLEQSLRPSLSSTADLRNQASADSADLPPLVPQNRPHDSADLRSAYREEKNHEKIQVVESFSSSGSSRGPNRSEDHEEDRATLEPQPEPRKPEEVADFRAWMFQMMRTKLGDPPREAMVRECLSKAHDWTIGEIIEAFRVNAQEKPGKPMAYCWFSTVLSDIYRRWEGKAPEMAGPTAETAEQNSVLDNSGVGGDTDLALDLEKQAIYSFQQERAVRECGQVHAPNCEHCEDTGESDPGVTCPGNCAAALALRQRREQRKREREEKIRWQTQSDRWNRLSTHQVPEVKRWMQFDGSCEFLDLQDLAGRDLILDLIAAGTHPKQLERPFHRASGGKRDPAPRMPVSSTLGNGNGFGARDLLGPALGSQSSAGPPPPSVEGAGSNRFWNDLITHHR